MNIVFQVPGRMGMIVTLYLISTNVYNCVEAPNIRGFSYIETWMVGTQIPILVSILEYGVILFWKKITTESVYENQTIIEKMSDLEEKIKKIDFGTMILSSIYFLTFVILYWFGNPLDF